MAMERQTKRLVIYAGVALIALVGLAVSLKDRGPAPEDARFSQVISEFITLSAAPDPRGMDFLSRNRIQQANRLARLDHIEPEVLARVSDALGIELIALRFQIADPQKTGPFDHTGVVFDIPGNFATGEVGSWYWALVTERAEIRASEAVEQAACGSGTPCRAWLVYWTETAWYYAPVGLAKLEDALIAARKEFAPILPSAGGI